MIVTLIVAAVGTAVTAWLARLWYMKHKRSSVYIQKRDLAHYKPARSLGGAILVSCVGAGITLYLCGMLWFGNYHNEHWVTCRIDSVENLGDGKYRIQSSGSSCGTFDNTDMFWRMKFNASSLQVWLKKDTTVQIRVVGAVSPDLGWYPNIVTVK